MSFHLGFHLNLMTMDFGFFRGVGVGCGVGVGGLKDMPNIFISSVILFSSFFFNPGSFTSL